MKTEINDIDIKSYEVIKIPNFFERLIGKKKERYTMVREMFKWDVELNKYVKKF